jgi:hypothetical protein
VQDFMSQLQNATARLRIVSQEVAGISMSNVASYLRTQADSLDDTASRCTDPVIVSELQEISAELRAEAEKLEHQSSSAPA